MKKRANTTTVIFHHSLSGEATIAEITEWHRLRGFSDIGYHFVIHKDGTIERGRSIELMGAHARGRNSTSIGVCIIGDFSKYSPSPTQYRQAQKVFNSLEVLYGSLKKEYHHETCPGELFDRGFFGQL